MPHDLTHGIQKESNAQKQGTVVARSRGLEMGRCWSKGIDFLLQAESALGDAWAVNVCVNLMVPVLNTVCRYHIIALNTLNIIGL
jgi:hypothetical protein